MHRRGFRVFTGRPLAKDRDTVAKMIGVLSRQAGMLVAGTGLFSRLLEHKLGAAQALVLLASATLLLAGGIVIERYRREQG